MQKTFFNLGIISHSCKATFLLIPMAFFWKHSNDKPRREVRVCVGDSGGDMGMGWGSLEDDKSACLGEWGGAGSIN